MKQILSEMAIVLILTGISYGDADKSGVKLSILSLAAGPGAIEGMGESFDPQLNSGTAS